MYSLAEWYASAFHEDKDRLQIDLERAESYKGLLDGTSAVVGASEPFVKMWNSGGDAGKAMKTAGKVLGYLGIALNIAEVGDIYFSTIGNEYNIERAVSYSGAISGPARESVYAAAYAERYMRDMLIQGKVRFEIRKTTFGKAYETISWRTLEAKNTYYHDIQQIYAGTKTVILGSQEAPIRREK